MKHADLQPDVALGWVSSQAFWMRSAGFPLGWLETCECPVDPADSVALRQWFEGGRVDRLTEFVALSHDPLVAEAIGLSNPDALDRVQRLAESDLGKINSRSRQRLRLYWMYMQRLCSKNDTCSFFGPISWGKVAPDGDQPDRFDVLDMMPDRDRQLFFEHWFVQRIADLISGDPICLASLPVRLNNGVELTDNGVTVPVDRFVSLQPGQLAQLQTIQQRQASTAPVLWGDVSADGFLAKMHEKGVVVTDIHVPTVLKYPLQWLSDHVALLELDTWPTRLNGLQGLLDVAQKQTGSDKAQTLAQIAEIASEWGVNLGRRSGEMYVGRYPTYEDAHRNVDLTLSQTTAQEITRDLAPLLSAYTGLVDRVAAALDLRYGQILEAIAPGGEASLLAVLRALSAQGDLVTPVVQAERARLQEIWSTAETFAKLGPDGVPGFELCFTAAHLHALFDQLDPPERIIPDLPWRYVHSPDIMVMAKDANAVASGDFGVVIGETHPGIYMVGQPVAAPFQPDGDMFLNDLGQVLQGLTPVMCDPAESYQRSNVNLPDCPNLMEITLPGQASRLATHKVINAAQCRVVQGDKCVELVVPERGIRVPLLTAMAGHLHKAIFALAGDLAGRSRSERLRVGRTVFQRRNWQIKAADMPKVERPAETPECFAKLALWAADIGLPRFVFAVVPGEPKPIYVDFLNPLSVDALAKLTKTVPGFRLSEMMPTRDDLVFADQRGAFTAEFRMSFIANQQQGQTS